MFKEAVKVAVKTYRPVAELAGVARVDVDHVLANHAKDVVHVYCRTRLRLHQELCWDPVFEKVKAKSVLVF